MGCRPHAHRLRDRLLRRAAEPGVRQAQTEQEEPQPAEDGAPSRKTYAGTSRSTLRLELLR